MGAARFDISAGDIGALLQICETIALRKYQRQVARTPRLEEEEKAI